MATNSWSNDKKLGLRSRIAVKLIMLAVKIVEPYEFGHQFEDDIKSINKLLNEE